MRRKLFEVEDCGYIADGKLLLAGRVEKDSLDFKAGDSIILSKPDGTEIETKIIEADSFKGSKLKIHAVFVEGIRKEEIPFRTIVFLK
jgi:hypothetical protein